MYNNNIHWITLPGNQSIVLVVSILLENCRPSYPRSHIRRRPFSLRRARRSSIHLCAFKLINHRGLAHAHTHTHTHTHTRLKKGSLLGSGAARPGLLKMQHKIHLFPTTTLQPCLYSPRWSLLSLRPRSRPVVLHILGLFRSLFASKAERPLSRKRRSPSFPIRTRWKPKRKKKLLSLRADKQTDAMRLSFRPFNRTPKWAFFFSLSLPFLSPLVLLVLSLLLLFVHSLLH